MGTAMVTHGQEPGTTTAAGGRGVIVMDWDARAQDNVEVTGNTLSGFEYGLRIGNSAGTQVLTNVTVNWNDITGNTTGVQVRASADGIALNNNNISGNTAAGIGNTDAGTTLDATGNWFGAADGPGGEGPGSGDAVGTDIDYSPWWAADYSDDQAHALPWTWGTDDSIQAAIDAATAGDTISIAAGTYHEDLSINKGITLDGGGAVTIGSSHTITSSNVTLTGLILNGAGNEVIVRIDSSGGPIDNISITNNTFNLQSGDVGIMLGANDLNNQAITNVSITDNTFNGPGDKAANPLRIGGWVGSNFDVPASNITFQRNTVDKASILVYLVNEDISNLTVTQNTFTNTDGVLYVSGNDDGAATSTGVLSNFSFTQNSVDGTNTYGVGFDPFGDSLDDDNFGTGIQITNNSFDGVPGMGGLPGGTFNAVSVLSTGFTGTIDASGNWYGSNTAAAVAAEVSTKVDYTPWLNSGTDTDGGTAGFQGDFSNLHVDDDSPQVGATGRVQGDHGGPGVSFPGVGALRPDFVHLAPVIPRRPLDVFPGHGVRMCVPGLADVVEPDFHVDPLWTAETPGRRARTRGGGTRHRGHGNFTPRRKSRKRKLTKSSGRCCRAAPGGASRGN